MERREVLDQHVYMEEESEDEPKIDPIYISHQYYVGKSQRQCDEEDGGDDSVVSLGGLFPSNVGDPVVEFGAFETGIAVVAPKEIDQCIDICSYQIKHKVDEIVFAALADASALTLWMTDKDLYNNAGDF